MIDSGNINHPLKHNFELCTLLYDDSLTKEISNDYILPDYLPDVAKILQVHTEHHVDEGLSSCSYNGKVYYHIIYVCDNNEIHHVLYSEDVNGEFSQGNTENNECVTIKYEICDVGAKLINPRKLSLKCKLHIVPMAFDSEIVSPVISGSHSPEADATLQYDLSDTKSIQVMNIKEDDIPISENINVDKFLPQISEIVYCTIKILPGEVNTNTGSCNIHSEVVADCIFIGDDKKIYQIQKHFPLSESFDHPEISENFTGHAYSSVQNIKAVAQQDQYGEMRVIEVDFTYNVNVLLAVNQPCTVTNDMFSTEYSTDVSMREQKVYSLSKLLNTNFSVNHSSPKENNLSNLSSNIILNQEELINESIKYDIDAGRHVYEATALINLVSLNEDNEREEYVSAKAEIPIRLLFDAPSGSGINKYKILSDIQNSRYRCDDNNLYADLEISLSVVVICEDTINIVSECKFDEQDKLTEVRKETMLLYYPYPEERIWDIGKKYHITPEILQNINGIDGDEMCKNIKVLLIPTSDSDVAYSQIIT